MSPSGNAVLGKKLEELEAQVSSASQKPLQLPLDNLTIFQIDRRITFLKTLLARESEVGSGSLRPELKKIAARLALAEAGFLDWAAAGAQAFTTETESNLRNKVEEDMEEIVERLSFIENNFSELSALQTDDGSVWCEHCLTNEDGTGHDRDQEEEEVKEEEEEEEAKTEQEEQDAVKLEEKMEAMALKADPEEKIASEFAEKVNRKKRRLCWSLKMLVAIGAATAVVVMIGLVFAGSDPVDESVYLVPT